MERTTQYRLLTARAGLAAGVLAGGGALVFTLVDSTDPTSFGLVWGVVFLGALLATCLSAVSRGRQQGERLWSRQARAVLRALAPAIFAALVLSVFFFVQGWHLWLPGVWMLCYGQGALATAVYSPRPITYAGTAILLCGPLTLTLGPVWANLMMGIVFGLGHMALGGALFVNERREVVLRLHRSVA
jgi:hypothetical protein